ncbi:MAG: cobalt-zinc-cadmium resistance protein CzcA [Segetibacter sp.]|nr:cobalt-zinc-cadmium resistance protein CzcA [Segetibacter sp.]
MNTLFIRLRLTGFLLPLIFGFLITSAQKSALDKYVQEGLSTNLVLQQKNLDVRKAYYSLKSAESLFLPTVNFEGSYQSGVGGRNIALPMGDLMNPVYTKLNQLLGNEKFSQIKNVEQDFLPNNFYDAKIRTSIPIVNTDLKYNRKIESQKADLQTYEVNIYKLELVQNIKVAYYNYLSALKVVNIYESALILANENKRTNEQLFKNGKGLPSYILRSQSEIEAINAHITEAKKAAENSVLYFNFLLNRNNDDIIDVSFNLEKEFNDAISLRGLEPDVSKRPELNALTEVVQLQGTIIKMNEKFRAPKISGFLDIGAQARSFNFNTQSPYYFAGVQVNIPIFNGKRNLYKIQQSRLDKKSSEIRLDLTSQQLTLAASTIKNNLIAIYQSYKSSLKSAEFSSSYQRLIERGFKEGINTFIENVDARNLLTSAQLQVSLNQYKVLIAAACFEHEIALIK